MKICYFGDYDPEYSRNRILIKGLRKNGVEVILCNETSKRFVLFKLIKKFLTLSGRFDLIIVGYSDSRAMVPLAKILTRKPIIWDAFYSIYDTIVNDRELTPLTSLKAKYYWFADWINCKMSDIILLDTNQHINYFSSQFKVKKSKFIRVWIGAEDSVFHP